MYQYRGIPDPPEPSTPWDRLWQGIAVFLSLWLVVIIFLVFWKLTEWLVEL